MDSFGIHKKNCLEKTDKSKIGAIDKDILGLINIINNSADYYTTSSCAGRIVLIAMSEDYKKNESEWLLSSHDTVSFPEVKEALLKLPLDKSVWFREESTIIHIDCRNLDSAIKIMNLFKPCGFKRAGITSIGAKIIVEILATEELDTIIAKDGKYLIDDEYLNVLIIEANKKLNRTKDKIKRAEIELRKKL